MVKISVLYPHKDGSAFNMNYYLNNHIPMVRQKLGAACKAIAVEQGIAGGAPESQPTYAAMGHLLFDSRNVEKSRPLRRSGSVDEAGYTQIGK